MDNTTLKEGFIGQKMIALPNDVLEKLKTNPITRNFYVSDLGFYPMARHHERIRKSGASQYIFIYCIKGKGEITTRNKKTSIAPNQFYIIPKNAEHEYRADKNDPWSIYWFHFDGILAAGLYKSYLYSLSFENINTPFSIRRIEQFDKIFSFFDRNYSGDLLEYANLLSLNFISSFIYRGYESDILIQQQDGLVTSVINYLMNHLGENLSLDEIAGRFNYSKSYLHKKFKDKTGYSIIAYFNLKKIQKACEYLHYTDLSIKEISFKMGFEDPLYFSRTFKNYMGKSPRRYKQTYRN